MSLIERGRDLQEPTGNVKLPRTRVIPERHGGLEKGEVSSASRYWDRQVQSAKHRFPNWTAQHDSDRLELGKRRHSENKRADQNDAGTSGGLAVHGDCAVR